MTDIRRKPGRERPTVGERQAEGGQIEKPRLTTSAMIASLAEEGQPTKSAPFGHALTALAETRPEIVGLTADLSKYTDLFGLAKAYPDRYYQMGMAEQLLMSAAAGWRERDSAFCHHLRGLRIAASLRFHLSRDRRGEAERQDRLCLPGLDDRLRRATRPMTWRSSAPCPT